RLRAVGRAGDAVAARADRVDDGARRADDDLAGDAAVLVTLGVVGDQADRGAVAGQDQQLAAGGPEVLVLIVSLGARAAPGVDVVEAVALTRGDVQAAGDRVAQRAGDRGGGAPGAVVAAGQLAFEAGGEGRGLGDDVDHAGRGVLAEQGALRALQHLDAGHFTQVAEADAVAGPVDAVDDHADRAFQTGVVTHGADAADTGGGDGFAGRRGDRQAGR